MMAAAPLLTDDHLPPTIDEAELAELGQGLGLAQRSVVFIPVNDAEEFFSGCTHW